jgi:hypothetical protein
MPHSIIEAARPNRAKLGVGALALAAVFALGMLIAGSSLAVTPPTTTQGVTPTLIEDDPNTQGNEGNVTRCFPLSAGKPIDGQEDTHDTELSIDGGNGTISVTYNADKSLDFTTSAGYKVVDVFVKGGPSTNWYAYNPAVTNDSGLFSPDNASGGPADVSHVVFCWAKDAQQSEWCSPGFWKNNADKHGAIAWPVPTSNLYTSVIPSVVPGPSPISGNPTLLQALQSPKTYFGAANQGAAFNAVGTYLSIEAGLVNVVEGTDNCPINQQGERI